VKEVIIEEKLCNFIHEFCDDLSVLELLLFFGRHPHARFNRTVVLHAISSKRFDTALALKKLIDKNLVVIYNENNIILYSLTKAEPAHSLTTQLLTGGQSQWTAIMEQILDDQDIV